MHLIYLDESGQTGTNLRDTVQPVFVLGALIAAIGLSWTMLADDLYGITIGFALASTGFGLTRPGFTAGASLAVPLAEQGGVAGVITSANGISFVAAPAIGMALYAVDPHLPFAASAMLLIVLVLSGRRQLDIS